METDSLVQKLVDAVLEVRRIEADEPVCLIDKEHPCYIGTRWKGDYLATDFMFNICSECIRHDCVWKYDLIEARKKMQELLDRLVQETVDHRNALAVVRVYRNVDWTQQPEEAVIVAVQTAIYVGATLLARSIASTGAKCYPDNAWLRKANNVLAPPMVLRMVDGNVIIGEQNNA